MPTSSILHETFKLAEPCSFQYSLDGNDHNPHASLWYGLTKAIDKITKDYIVPTTESKHKHYTIVILPDTYTSFDFDTTVDVMPDLTSAVINAISRRIYRKKIKESCTVSSEMYIKTVMFINNAIDGDIVVFDLVKLNVKCEFTRHNGNPNYVFDVKGEIELLTDEDELRHDFKNGVWGALKYIWCKK